MTGAGAVTGTRAGAGTGAGAGSGAGAGTGSGSASVSSGARGPGVGWRACSVSGNCVVARSGTLVSTRLLKTPIASVERSDDDDWLLIARLDCALLPGLIGNAYW